MFIKAKYTDTFFSFRELFYWQVGKKFGCVFDELYDNMYVQYSKTQNYSKHSKYCSILEQLFIVHF